MNRIFAPVWDRWVSQHHYLGYRQLLGHRIKYFAFLQNRPVAAFVDRYMKKVDEEWEKLEKGYVEGTNTPEENLHLAGRRSLGLVFDIITKGWIEEYENLPEDDTDDPDVALDLLVGRIMNATGKSRDVTELVIRKFYQDGNIQIQHGTGGSKWGWPQIHL